MAKKTAAKSEWNTWHTVPNNSDVVIVVISGVEHQGTYFEDGEESKVFLTDGTSWGINELGGSQWKLKPAASVSNETKPGKDKLLDTKKIPDETARRWIAEKMLEEFGTVALDLELNTPQIIVYYNAGTVKK